MVFPKQPHGIRNKHPVKKYFATILNGFYKIQQLLLKQWGPLKEEHSRKTKTFYQRKGVLETNVLRV